jgi:hypothetical protein
MKGVTKSAQTRTSFPGIVDAAWRAAEVPTRVGRARVHRDSRLDAKDACLDAHSALPSGNLNGMAEAEIRVAEVRAVRHVRETREEIEGSDSSA